MMKFFNANSKNSIKRLEIILGIRKQKQQNQSKIVKQLLANVKKYGDKAVIKYEKKFSKEKGNIKFIKFSDNEINEYIQEINESGLSLAHEKQSVIPDKYEDLPFLSVNTLKGKYIYISMEEWNQETKLEAIKYLKIKNWPTPLASDWHFYRMNKPNKKSTWGDVEARNVNSLPACIHWEEKSYKTHQVNPRWFEQMMGLPIGWTDPYL